MDTLRRAHDQETVVWTNCLGSTRRYHTTLFSHESLLLCFLTKACKVQGKRPPSPRGVGLPVCLATSMTSLCCALSIQVVGRKKEFKDDSSSGVVVSEGGDIFFGALQNPRPNFLVLDIFEVLDAMTPPMLEELAVLDGSHMGFPS